MKSLVFFSNCRPISDILLAVGKETVLSLAFLCLLGPRPALVHCGGCLWKASAQPFISILKEWACSSRLILQDSFKVYVFTTQANAVNFLGKMERMSISWTVYLSQMQHPCIKSIYCWAPVDLPGRDIVQWRKMTMKLYTEAIKLQYCIYTIIYWPLLAPMN